jgi:hypothetical protein
MISDAIGGRITKLPGGIKCEDLFNNDQPLCFLEIEVGTITSGTTEDVRYLLEHRNSYPRKISGSMVTLDSLGETCSLQSNSDDLSESQKLPAVIDSFAKCVSACVFVLAGAVQRTIRPSLMTPSLIASSIHLGLQT